MLVLLQSAPATRFFQKRYDKRKTAGSCESAVVFNVYCFNIQPGIVINYADGSSKEGDPAKATTTTKATTKSTTKSTTKKSTTAPVRNTTKTTTKKSTTKPVTKSDDVTGTYILNTNTHKFHYPECGDVNKMAEKNKQSYTGSRNALISQGYSPCGHCHP